MVPTREGVNGATAYFPRIRGDGPRSLCHPIPHPQFSPYSRGWSLYLIPAAVSMFIFPVFAGMVPGPHSSATATKDFPRIRGDGPWAAVAFEDPKGFSPYSRGWSCRAYCSTSTEAIFPVFAGMVPHENAQNGADSDFPRIRGDGPRSRFECRAHS